MTSKFQICCEALMEAAWLAVIVTIPLFFNISSSRMFEPDKVYVLKFLLVISCAAWLIKRISLRLTAAEQATPAEQRAPFFKLPLVIPLLALVAIYTLSSIFSIWPAESWWGSYSRSQGTVVFYCYIILALIVLSELRIPAQLKRLQYAFILTSLPVSAYSILQFFGSDFIPWTNFIHDRSSGSMGNPIFLGAYLIMVVPLTFGRLIDGIGMLRTDDDRRPGFVLTGVCGVALSLQFLALLCTQSRGPMLGLVVAGYICIFVFLVLRRTAGNRGFLYPAAAVGLGCAIPVLIIAIVYMVWEFSDFAATVWIIGAIVFIGAVYVTLWRVPWGKNWLWLTWLIQTAALLLMIAVGPAQIIGQDGEFPRIGRWTKFSGTSINARYYLWQTGYDAMRSDSPVPLSNESGDSFHSLRSVIGYGPECIWFPVNLHAPPELIEIHSGASDRMHNEAFDSLIATGFAGAALYLFLISAAIFYALQYVNLISGVRQKIAFAVLLVLGSGMGVLYPWLAGSPQMAPIGVQAGLLIGLLAYIGFSGFRSTRETSAIDSRQLFVFCIMGSLIAHFTEAAVGIAVTPTRTYFFLLLAILSVLASGRLKQGAIAKNRGSKPRPWHRTPLAASMAITSFAVLTEAWCFIINSTAERSAVKLFIDNWFVQSEQKSGFLLPGNLLILLLTIGAGIALAYAEKGNLHLSKKNTRKIPSTFFTSMLGIWFVTGFLAAVFWAAKDPSISSPMGLAIQSEARFTLFLFELLLLLAATALVLMVADSRKYSGTFSIRDPLFWIGLLLTIGAFVVTYHLTVRPAWADITCHTARVFERAGSLPAAIQVYERSVQLAPRNANYLISLGRVQNNSAAPNSSQLQESVQTLQRAVDFNPLNSFHHQALGALYMKIGEQTTDPAARNAQIHKAIASFQQVIRLAPSSKGTYDSLGRCFFLLGDYKSASESYEESMRMHPEDEQAFMLMGELQYTLNDLVGALESFTEAARLAKHNLEARKNVGSMLILLDRKEEAIREALNTLKMAPQDLMLLRRLSSLYFSTGDYNSGLEFARRAYEATPDTDKPDFDAFLKVLRNQIK